MWRSRTILACRPNTSVKKSADCDDAPVGGITRPAPPGVILQLWFMLDTTAFTKAVASVLNVEAFLDTVSEILLAEPTVPANEHGRVDVVYTVAEARLRARASGKE